MSIKMTAVVLAAMVGGAAQAAPELVIGDDNGFADVLNRYFDGGLQGDSDGTSGAFLANPGTYSYAAMIPTENLGPGIDGAFSTASLTSSFSSTGFSFVTHTAGEVDTNENFEEVAANLATARGRTSHTGSVTLTEDAMVRIRIDGSVISSEPNTEWAHRVAFSGEGLSPIVIGMEDNTTASSFDVTLDLAAGEYSWELFASFGVGSASYSPPEGYSWDASLDFSFEIVPAPGAAALFGLGGLAAARRRR